MSSSPEWECDVFVSFKSGGPVGTFTSDLFQRLDQVGIRYLEDDNRKKAPEDFKDKRNKALEQVRLALVVFCESYDSRCLDGLVELLKNKKDPKLVVIPIYFADRAAVPLTYVEALGTKAGEISGYVLRAANDDELKKLLDKIVDRLVNEIRSLCTHKNFSRSGKINGISIVYNKGCIKSIAFEVKHDTDNKQQKDGPCEVKFKDGEYITSFAGYFDKEKKRINSLEFRTNKGSTLGPFGKTEGEYFSVPSKGWKVIEFFVLGNDFLTSIGARVERETKKFCPVIVQRVGLIGKKSGYKWDDGHHHANVRKIIGKYDSKSSKKPSEEPPSIRSIEFEYEETDKKSWRSETHGDGDVDGNNFSTEEIEMGPNEHLTAISAVCEGDYIKSLTFRIGEKRIKTISVDEKNNEKGATSSTAARSDQKKETTLKQKQNSKIVGFYGWRDRRLYGIGAYFEGEPIRRGDPWDDKEFFGVREIYLLLDKTDSTHIRGIRFVYDDRSKKGATIHHGEDTGQGSYREEKCTLAYPGEYLTSISGCTREDDAIKSLTFHSNRKTYCLGPSVKEEERFFWYPSTGSKITGFYGTFDNETLQSIGVYAAAVPHTYPFKTIGPFGGLEGVAWDDTVHTDVRAFRVTYDNDGLHSISFMYDDKGSLVEGPQRGRGDAGKWIWLDFPNERLSSITVWKVEVKKGKEKETTVEKETIISHLKITTTADTYGPYPSEPKGKPDEIKLDGDSSDILRYNRVGFFGRAGRSYLNAIGAHFEQN